MEPFPVSPGPIIDAKRPTSFTELVKADPGKAAVKTYHEFYKAWVRDHSPLSDATVNLIVATQDLYRRPQWRDPVEVFNGLVALPEKKGPTWDLYTKAMEANYSDFYQYMGEVKDAVHARMSTDGSTAQIAGRAMQVDQALSSDASLADWLAQGDGMVAMGTRDLKPKVAEALRNYQEGTGVPNPEGKPFPGADAVKLIETALHGSLHVAEQQWGEMRRALTGVTDQTDATRRMVADHLERYARACEEVAQGLSGAAQICWKWAVGETERKLKAGFRAEHPWVWGALQATKIAVGVTGTILQYAGPAAAITGPIFVGVGVAVEQVDGIIKKIIVHEQARDLDTVTRLTGKEYETVVGKATGKVGEFVGELGEQAFKRAEQAEFAAKVVKTAAKPVGSVLAEGTKASLEGAEAVVHTAMSGLAVVMTVKEIGVTIYQAADWPRLEAINSPDEIEALRRAIVLAYESRNLGAAYGTRVVLGKPDGSGNYRVTIGDETGWIANGRFTEDDRSKAAAAAVEAARGGRQWVDGRFRLRVDNAPTDLGEVWVLIDEAELLANAAAKNFTEVRGGAAYRVPASKAVGRAYDATQERYVRITGPVSATVSVDGWFEACELTQPDFTRTTMSDQGSEASEAREFFDVAFPQDKTEAGTVAQSWEYLHGLLLQKLGESPNAGQEAFARLATPPAGQEGTRFQFTWDQLVGSARSGSMQQVGDIGPSGSRVIIGGVAGWLADPAGNATGLGASADVTVLLAPSGTLSVEAAIITGTYALDDRESGTITAGGLTVPYDIPRWVGAEWPDAIARFAQAAVDGMSFMGLKSATIGWDDQGWLTATFPDVSLGNSNVQISAYPALPEELYDESGNRLDFTAAE
jgi:hypothetical protein